MLEVIKNYQDKHGYPPNECELTRLTGYSRNTVRAKLKELEKSKQIKKIVVPPRGHYEVIHK